MGQSCSSLCGGVSVEAHGDGDVAAQCLRECLDDLPLISDGCRECGRERRGSRPRHLALVRARRVGRQLCGTPAIERQAPGNAHARGQPRNVIGLCTADDR